ncbi:YbbR-like domain-containing protein [Bacillota bacterium Meth-B3]
MRNNLEQIVRATLHFLKALWGLFSQNLGMKLLSLLFALFLWSYVITSNPSITREKALSNLDVIVTGQAVLTSRRLAVLKLDELREAQLRVRVSQSLFPQVTNDSVRVELDLSSIRTSGRQQVKLRGITTYGSVAQVLPEYVEVEVDALDERVVPVNVALQNADPARWYAYAPNPSQITVSGPASVVKQVSKALVAPDVTGRLESYNSTAEPFILVDAQDQEVASSLSASTSSITVGLSIYPTRLVDITDNPAELIRGNVARGYEVTSVEVSPKQIRVAGEQSLLDGLTELAIEPVDVTGRNHTFPAVARVTALKGVQNLSSVEVSVTVAIDEMKETQRFKNIPIDFINEPGGKRVSYSAQAVDALRVTGPASVVQKLRREHVQATVDLSGLLSGQYELPIVFQVASHPELTFETKAATVSVTVEDITG